jgi:hypothetical protein
MHFPKKKINVETYTIRFNGFNSILTLFFKKSIFWQYMFSKQSSYSPQLKEINIYMCKNYNQIIILFYMQIATDISPNLICQLGGTSKIQEAV